MDDFYQNDFDKSKQVCGFNPNAKLVVDEIKNMGLKVVLATNPIFPAVATQKRMSWAGFSSDDFELYTTYENSRFCKPNLEYYKDILAQLDLKAEECLMVGNDVTEDMVAQKLGFKVLKPMSSRILFLLRLLRMFRILFSIFFCIIFLILFKS